MLLPKKLTANAIKNKIENSADISPESELVLQILDHKVFDSSSTKKGIKSR